MKLPWQIAKEYWQENNPCQPFEVLLGKYISNGGYVWSSPDFFILGFKAVIESVGEPRPDSEGNAWFIHLAATSPRKRGVSFLSEFMRLAPEPLPFIAFHRRGKWKVYRWEKMEEMLNRKELCYG